jgi:hypothetical protein
MTDAPIHDLTIEILKGIRSDLAGLREEMAGLRGEARATNQRLDALESATVGGFKRMEARFDNLLTFAGDRYREHEGRIAACEQSIKELRERIGA